uniref:Putative ixostatin n=1 Tax=Ixodes ricinus TaxID=34613 RepID=A0A0K8RB68_IXORI
MISTRTLLVAAALVLVCIAVSKAIPDVCRPVTITGSQGTGAFRNAADFLGQRCKAHYSANKSVTNLDGTWIGDVSKGAASCRVCCVHKNTTGHLTYSEMKAPTNFPCDKKKNKICNKNGLCVEK